MKKFVFSILALAFLSVSCEKTTISSITKPQEVLKIDSVPQLTYKQMLEEHDSLISYIKQISPIIYFNKEVRGIDFEKLSEQLNKKITATTTMPEYLDILYKTINVAQDNHTSLLSSSFIKKYIQKYWIPSGVKVIGYDSLAVDYARHYDKYFNKRFKTKLNLELVYTNGEYYNLLPFKYKNKNYPSKMKLLKCNGKEIHNEVEKMIELVSALKWDRDRNITYYEDFYKSSSIYENDTLVLDFIAQNKKEYRLKIAKQDTVTFLKKIKTNFSYNDNTKVTSHYYAKEKLFYAKLPQMEISLGDSLKNRLKSVTDKNPVKSIVLDIRGNGGGSDLTYINFLKKVIKEPLSIHLKLGRNYSNTILDYYSINKDTIIKHEAYRTNLENVPVLETQKMFYIEYPEYKFVTPDTIKYPFDGKIYILQDRFIYSSSSNLSNLAYKSEQLISIGENPNLLGGLQTNPIAISLPYSKLFLRIEPQIDFTNIKTKADIFQNNVEYPVNYTIDFLHERTTTNEDVLSKDFLYNKDPMFKKVLELEK